ncbi:hypothetical protein BH20ACI2_BH20ACI2_25340 [soil metagenome]
MGIENFELRVENWELGIETKSRHALTRIFQEDLIKENVLKTNSYAFALRIIKVYKFMSQELREYVLAKQLLRSGTSIGANIAEANQAQSTPDFVSKMGIALKETVETEYWLSLLRDSGFLTIAQADSLLSDCNEIKAILTAVIKTAKQKKGTS